MRSNSTRRAGLSSTPIYRGIDGDTNSPDKLHEGRKTDAKDEGKEPGPGVSGDTVDRKARDAGGAVKEEGKLVDPFVI